jgi:hypothetical protein
VVCLARYMLLRYVKLCKRVCLWSGLLGLLILLPVYLHGGKQKVTWTLEFALKNPVVVSLVSGGDTRGGIASLGPSVRERGGRCGG